MEAARVVKPDGTVVELKKEDIFDRTVARMSGLKEKAKTFALPGVEPGSIIEYRWRETRPGNANNIGLFFQRDIPVRSVAYYIKPYSGMRYRPINMGDARFEEDKDGYYRLAATNMPAFREEPRMPPEKAVRSWVFLYRAEDKKLGAEQYWKDTGRSFYEFFDTQMQPGEEVKAAVAGRDRAARGLRARQRRVARGLQRRRPQQVRARGRPLA